MDYGKGFYTTTSKHQADERWLEEYFSGKNPISIICPCHRVIGSDGRMTGYAWGTDVKMKFLELEKTRSCFPNSY